MNNPNLEIAIAMLREAFSSIDFQCTESKGSGRAEIVYQWPGTDDEDILICVHQSSGVQEPFHRHDYFYFNYTYKGCYESLSDKYDRKICIRENELYAGQPFAGHALCVHDDQDTIIFGVLIKRETFLHAFLPMLSTSSRLFHFFLDPSTSHYAEEYIHFKVEDQYEVRALLEMMIVEYAFKKHDTNQILKALALAFLMQITRRYSIHSPQKSDESLSGQIVQYMSEHLDVVTLKDIAAHFSYHPNYISSVIRKEQGKTFSAILLEQRMSRAEILLKSTELPIEEIAAILGYSNSSNFYKAFREYFGCAPRAYTTTGGNQTP